MKPSIICRLNKLNEDFYQKIAIPFSHSRETAWEGWQQLLPFLKDIRSEKEVCSVLDLGCGNGRFGQFLFQQFPNLKWQYHGVDNSQELLKIAQEQDFTQHIPSHFTQLDIVELLLQLLQDNSEIASHFSAKYDLIVCFGVLHHIPSSQLRQKFFQLLDQLLQPQGIICLTTWDFTQSPNLMKRAIPPEELHFTPADLEENDYFLTWERGASAARYCHWISPKEFESLVAHSARKIRFEYRADGKYSHSNHYVILQQPPLL